MSGTGVPYPKNLFSLMEDAIVSTLGRLSHIPGNPAAAESSNLKRSYARHMDLYAAVCDLCEAVEKTEAELSRISAGATPMAKVVNRSRFEDLKNRLDAFGEELIAFGNLEGSGQALFRGSPYFFWNMAESVKSGAPACVHFFGMLGPVPVLKNGRTTVSVSVPTLRPPPLDGLSAEYMLQDLKQEPSDPEWRETVRARLVDALDNRELDLSDPDVLRAALAGASESVGRISECRRSFGNTLREFFTDERIYGSE